MSRGSARTVRAAAMGSVGARGPNSSCPAASILEFLAAVVALFSGESINNTTLLVKYTRYGDANFDGQVNISDLGRLATAWRTSGSWVNADFNYDGFIDIGDLGMLATNWQAGVNSPLGPGFDQALGLLGLKDVVVPEPSVLAFLGAAAAMWRRRGTRPL